MSVNIEHSEHFHELKDNLNLEKKTDKKNPFRLLKANMSGQ
jgi:hypothetical protein